MGKFDKKEISKDWRVLEFVMPITEAKMVGEDFMITGIAINETTTRNGIKYTVDELEACAHTFRGKPILLDHENKVENIVGRTTENVNFSREKRGITFEARIVNENIKEKINQGLITDVSIGASVKDLVEEEDGSRKAVGLEGMEISLVAVPGDPNANIAQAMDNSFVLRESMSKKNAVLSETLLNDILNKLKGGIKEMSEEEEQKQEEKPEESEEETTSTETATEEIDHNTNVNVDMSAVTEAIRLLSEKVESLTKVKEEAEEETTKEEPEVATEDETKGEVAVEDPEESETTESMVLEQAESGKGFAIWRDYSKEVAGESKLKRLIR